MSQKSWGIISVVSFLLALIFSLIAAGLLDSQPLVDERAQRCEGGPQATVQRIVDRSQPQAQSTDPATGVVYLRYSRQIITVTPKGEHDCTVQTEDLSRFNTGFFTFLGPGFTPSSPSDSSYGSSGSSGSSGGVK